LFYATELIFAAKLEFSPDKLNKNFQCHPLDNLKIWQRKTVCLKWTQMRKLHPKRPI